MDKNKRVRVESLVSHTVVLTVPDIHLRRVWEKKGAIAYIPFEQLEEAMYSPGVEALFRNGTLGIDDMEVKVALNLEPEGAAEPVNIITLTDKQRETYLTIMPIQQFKERIAKLPIEQINELAAYAIEHEIVNYEKSEAMKPYIHIDVVKAIQLNQDDKATQER